MTLSDKARANDSEFDGIRHHAFHFSVEQTVA